LRSSNRSPQGVSVIATTCGLLGWSGHFGGELHKMGEEMSDYETIVRKPMTPAQREARRIFAAAEAKKALSEHEKAQKAFYENRERLKAERLAREAEAPNKKTR
jgi:hypothetical protein